MEFKKDINYKGNFLINFINLNNEEIETVRNWRNHDAVRCWMYHDHIISSEEHRSFIEKLKEDSKNICWLVKDVNSEYIGVITLNKIDKVNEHAYLGIYSNPLKKTQGAGRLLIDCLKYAAFNCMNLHTLKLEVISSNTHAKNFYETAGFGYEGLLKEFVSKNGKWINVEVYGIINKGKE